MPAAVFLAGKPAFGQRLDMIQPESTPSRRIGLRRRVHIHHEASLVVLSRRHNDIE
jgi:hypothetical protein